MFTGIITALGEVLRVEKNPARDYLLEIGCPYDLGPYDLGTVAIGASIAHSGICLTVIAKTEVSYTLQASAETCATTTLGDWERGTKVNLERALKVGDELGGHIVSGHVDGVARVVEMRPENDSVRMIFEAPSGLARFIAPKGSVALDGVSLTVNEVEGCRFGVNVIAHTQAVTTFKTLRQGHRVNLEIDMLARYVARLTEKD